MPFWRAGSTQAVKPTKFGPNGLYVLAAISKMAWAFIYFLMKNDCLVTILHEFIVKCVWNFFSYQYMLETAVSSAFPNWQLIQKNGHFKTFQYLLFMILRKCTSIQINGRNTWHIFLHYLVCLHNNKQTSLVH